MSHLTLRLLGPPQLERDGRSLKFDTRKALALVAYLALRPTGSSRDELAALFWPEEDQGRARSYLRYTLWALKKALGEEWLGIEREHLGLVQSSHFWLDVAHFQAQLAACRAHGHPADAVCALCLPLLTDAAKNYRGDFMAGFSLADSPGFEEWQLWQREEWQQSLANVLVRLAQGHSAQGEFETAATHARHWLSLDPLNEAAHRLLMQLYAWSGKPAMALRQYQSCQQLLAKELEVPPEQATTALYESIKAGQLPPRPQISATPNRVLSTAILAWSVETEQTICVAREPQLAQMSTWLDQALAGQGRVIFVTGEAGSGKTVLLREFARRAQIQTTELLVASGFCLAPTGLGDPYLPFRNIMRLLTGDLEGTWIRRILNQTHAHNLWAASPQAIQALVTHGPDLIPGFIPGPSLWERAMTLLPTETEWLAQLKLLTLGPAGKLENIDLEQSNLMEQVTNVLHALARQRPLLLLIDDLHWADAASLNLLFYLGQRLADVPILLVGSYRPGDLALGQGQERHPLEPVINELQRTFGDIAVNLDEAQGREFVEAWLDTQPNRLEAAFRATLYRHTQGQPLFTVELLRAMRARGEIVQDETGYWVEGEELVWGRVPARVAAVIQERIGRLPESLHQLLSVASVEGDAFTVQVLVQVLDRPERVVLSQLRELEKRYRLIQQRGELQIGSQHLSRYQFNHTLFQQHLYQELSPGERRLLHGEIATALAGLYAARPEEMAGSLAHHYAQAGDSEKAVKYLLLAGDRARGLYAYQAAVAAYQQALLLLKVQRNFEQAAHTLMKLGLTHHLFFHFRQARQAYREGFDLWQRVGEMVADAALTPAVQPLRIDWLDPPTLDPTLSGTRTSGCIIEQLFSGLVSLSPELDVIPDVAQIWEVLDGGRTYLFHLRQDTRWSDGTPVTAADFVYAWRRMLDPATAAFNANLLHDIRGARAYHSGQISDPTLLGIKAVDDFTLAVELESPAGYFLHAMTNCASYPVPQHIVARCGEAWTKTDRLVSNGPFLLAAWEPGQAMILERNPMYHGLFTGNIQQVKLSFLSPATADKLSLYAANELDIVSKLLPREWDRARRLFAGEYVLGPLLETRYVGFDARRPPFNDVRVRRAFVLATDREKLATSFWRGYYFPATGGFIPFGMPGHSADIGLPYDSDQARQLLAEAGYANGRNFPVITALRPPGEEVGALSEALRAQWREVLQVDIEWEVMAWGILRLEKEPPPLFLIGWTADYPDPDNFLRVAAQDGGWWRDDFAGLVEQARRLTNQDSRMQLYRQADQILIESATIMPIFYGQSHLLIKPWVTRFPTSAVDRWFWQDVVIEPH